jgi:hypothetical protein
MRISIVIALAVAAFLGAAPPATAADQLALLRPAAKMTPWPDVRPAACRFWQCNCRPDCVIYEGERCVRSIQTCDVCSKCDD